MSDRPLVIAEAGVNHNGDRARALAMVDVAAAAGADIVKFQSFAPERLVARDTPTARYQRDNTGTADQRTLLSKLALGPADFAAIAERCRLQGIEFLCTAFEPEQISAFIAAGMRRIKIASGEMTNTVALRTAARHGVPVLLSTGMATMDEVAESVAELRRAGCAAITLLHCTSLYPAPDATANLRAMTAMRERFALPVGYSDHSAGDHIAVAAVALGAVAIEKHFTLDRTLPGPDHRASLEPGELAALMRKIVGTAEALGDGVKRPAPGEMETARLVRRSWHAARALEAGCLLAPGDLVLLRPSAGLAPADDPAGRRLVRARAADEPIRAEDVA